MPQIDNQAVFSKARSVHRQPGGGKPYAGSQNLFDALCRVRFNKVRFPVELSQFFAERIVIDDKIRGDLRQIFLDIFK